MSSKGDEDIFIEKMEIVSQRTEELYRNIKEIPWQHAQLMIACLNDLQLALEELRIAEEELRQQNEELLEARQATELERQRYQELFEFAPDGYVVTDMYGVVREANFAAAQLLNIAQSHLVGKPIISFISEEHRRVFRSMLNQLHTMSRVQEWEVRLCRRGGEWFDAALSVQTVRDQQGQAIALRWLLRDITARKQAENQLHQIKLQNLQLVEADRIKTQFMGMMSHELRTPMNAILGFSELLLRRFHQYYDPQYITLVERIFQNGRHLLAIIEDMLDFSKLRANRLELQVQSFDLAELAIATTEELRSLAEQKALDLRVCLTPSSMPVSNDPVRVRQILVNLLSNAIKFTDTGSVSLEIWETSGEQVAIAVSDTGSGIDPADQGRIFEEFWQVNQSRTRRHGGTGLGLAIVHALIQLMGGSISVKSQLGEGSIFRVELPRRVSC